MSDSTPTSDAASSELAIPPTPSPPAVTPQPPMQSRWTIRSRRRPTFSTLQHQVRRRRRQTSLWRPLPPARRAASAASAPLPPMRDSLLSRSSLPPSSLPYQRRRDRRLRRRRARMLQQLRRRCLRLARIRAQACSSEATVQPQTRTAMQMTATAAVTATVMTRC